MKTQFILIFFLFFPIVVYSQNCDCEKELEWVIKTFSENDAGFQYIVDKKGENNYNLMSEAQLQKAKDVKDIQTCEALIWDWLRYFRNSHISISAFYGNEPPIFSFFMPENYTPALVKKEVSEPVNTAGENAIKAKSPKTPYIKNLSEQTLYLYIPSLSAEYAAKIDSVIAAHEDALNKTDNLIIDIRDSRGGGDNSYQKILPYLYTSPIRKSGMEIRATEDNAIGFDKTAKMLETFGQKEQAGYCRIIAEEMRENLGSFFVQKGLPSVQIDSSYTRSAYPKKVGIICDRKNGSADEEFLLTAKQSSKVKVFGRTTIGSLDISNLNFSFSPNGIFYLVYGTTRSLRIPDFCIDDIGIQPDYFIDKTVSDWAKFAQDILEQK